MCIAIVLSICSAHRDPFFNTMIKPPCGKKAWVASESFLTQVLPVDSCLLLAKLGCRLLPFSWLSCHEWGLLSGHRLDVHFKMS